MAHLQLLVEEIRFFHLGNKHIQEPRNRSDRLIKKCFADVWSRHLKIAEDSDKSRMKTR